jgi:sortase (surface protein transpeptidase)
MSRKVKRLTVFYGSGIFLGFILLYAAFMVTEPLSTTRARTDEVPYSSTSTVVSVQVAPALPARLIIPRIQVDALVQSVGLDNGALGVPTNFTDVAWYKNGPRPGMVGSAVIDGHRSGKRVPHGVFFDLKQMVTGDIIKSIDQNGATSTFVVTAVTSYPYNATTDAVFSSNDNLPHLNLITCGGVWDKGIALFTERIVVFSTLVP